MKNINPIIKEMRNQKQLKIKIEENIRALKEKCPHHFFKSELQESMAFEYTAYIVCEDCGNNVREENKEKVISLYKEHLEFFIEKPVSYEAAESFYLKHPRGFNLVDIKDIYAK